jgi:hypothetical protein
MTLPRMGPHLKHAIQNRMPCNKLPAGWDGLPPTSYGASAACDGLTTGPLGSFSVSIAGSLIGASLIATGGFSASRRFEGGVGLVSTSVQTGPLSRSASGGNFVVHSAATVAEQLALIRRALPLATAHVAAIVGVSRPTLYAWRQDVTQAVRKHDSLERLRQLANWAALWESWEVGRLGMTALTAAPQGVSLRELLEQKPWNTTRIESTFAWLRQHAERRRSRIANRADLSAVLRRMRSSGGEHTPSTSETSEGVVASVAKQFEEYGR